MRSPRLNERAQQLLEHLNKLGPIDAGDLAEALHTTPSSLTSQLQALKRRGMAERLEGGEWQAVEPADDSGVPHVEGDFELDVIEAFVQPNGAIYRRARPSEHADVVRVFPRRGTPPLRLVLFGHTEAEPEDDG